LTIPGELNTDLAYKIGRTLIKYLNAKLIVVGHDIRESSEELSEALSRGITDSGSNVIDIGLCGTEMIYYSTPHFNADGGVMITASHNPPEYNGLKFVKEGSKPMGYDTDLKFIEKMILEDNLGEIAGEKGTVKNIDIMKEFINNLKRFYSKDKIKPFKVVVNAGNGCVGPALDAIEPDLPIQMIKVFHNPDSKFPNGVPNPLLIQNRQPTIDAIKENDADFGVAWDGDYDRCFFFDHEGNFIEGYYIVGILAKSILKKFPGENIIHDPRLVWNTIEVVNKAGGKAVVSKSGHAYIKQKMREVNAVYGGEMSAHHYFRENNYSDSGMIPFLLILELMSDENKSLHDLVYEMIKEYPCSGEINSKIDDPNRKLEKIKEKYSDGKMDFLDGVSVEYDNWRFNVRKSNTEPLLRLNVESKGDIELMKRKTEELLNLIRS